MAFISSGAYRRQNSNLEIATNFEVDCRLVPEECLFLISLKKNSLSFMTRPVGTRYSVIGIVKKRKRDNLKKDNPFRLLSTLVVNLPGDFIQYSLQFALKFLQFPFKHTP